MFLPLFYWGVQPQGSKSEGPYRESCRTLLHWKKLQKKMQLIFWLQGCLPIGYMKPLCLEGVHGKVMGKKWNEINLSVGFFMCYVSHWSKFAPFLSCDLTAWDSWWEIHIPCCTAQGLRESVSWIWCWSSYSCSHVGPREATQPLASPHGMNRYPAVLGGEAMVAVARAFYWANGRGQMARANLRMCINWVWYYRQ